MTLINNESARLSRHLPLNHFSKRIVTFVIDISFMPQHETKQCPRCKAPFECKVGNISECQCSGITFNDDEKHYISQSYADCLCRKCLLEIKHEIRLKSFNRQSEEILKPINKKD